jgi:hypothetical protein
VVKIAKEERECEPIAYVHGGITISPKPPSQFKVGVRVNVSGVEAALSGPIDGENHVLWNYLAVVKPGLVSVTCVVGNVMVTKQIDAKPDQINIVNFCFGNPVTTSKDVEIIKVKGKKARVVRKKKAEDCSTC